MKTGLLPLPLPRLRVVRARLAVPERDGAVLLLLSGIERTATILTPSVAAGDGRKVLVCHGYYHTATRGKEYTRTPGSTLSPPTPTDTGTVEPVEAVEVSSHAYCIAYIGSISEVEARSVSNSDMCVTKG